MQGWLAGSAILLKMLHRFAAARRSVAAIRGGRAARVRACVAPLPHVVAGIESPVRGHCTSMPSRMPA